LDYSSHRQQQNKRIKTKNKQYGFNKLNWDTAKAMNGTKVPQEKIDNIIEAIY
jgi:hypothetical protein